MVASSEARWCSVVVMVIICFLSLGVDTSSGLLLAAPKAGAVPSVATPPCSFSCWSTRSATSMSIAARGAQAGTAATEVEAKGITRGGFYVDGTKTSSRTTVSVAAAPVSATTEFQDFVLGRNVDVRRVVVDLRSREDFDRKHLVGATSIPADELEARLLELPPPFGEAISLAGDDKDLSRAYDFLTAKGWQIGAQIRGDALGDGPDDLPEAVLTEAGPRSVQAWSANNFLEFCMSKYILPVLSGSGSSRQGLVIDLGCGSGRDTVYMAQHLPSDSRIIGVDNHSHALERGAKLAKQWVSESRGGRSEGEGGGSSDGEGARRACEWWLTDLRKDGALDGVEAFIIHGHRFKCEQLLPTLRDEVLNPGGFFIWSTFLDSGEENAVPPWRPSRMMRPGELASIFAGDDFDILVDERGELPTRGSSVPANFFACRKKLHA